MKMFNKMILGLVMTLMIASPVMAASVSVSPELGVNFRDEFKTSVSEGFLISASDINLPVVSKNIVVSTGFNYSETETADNKVKDINLYTVPVEIGYKVAIDEKLTVTPFVGADFIFADNDVVDDTIGGRLGSAISYKVNNDWSANLKASWAFASTEVNGKDSSLNGGRLVGGATYSF